MADHEEALKTTLRQNDPAPKDSARGAVRALQVAFLAVLAVCPGSVSYNCVDPDVWGHVLYGQRAWLRGVSNMWIHFHGLQPGTPG